jgi:flagellar hook-basal body complex protein FliE
MEATIMATCTRCGREVEDDKAYVSVFSMNREVMEHTDELTDIEKLKELQERGLLKFHVTCKECFSGVVTEEITEINNAIEEAEEAFNNMLNGGMPDDVLNN